MLLPTTCPLCLAVGPAPCAACIARLDAAPALAPPPGVERCDALFAYEGAGAELVQRLKYANHRDAVATLALGLARLVAAGGEVSVVTWVPASPSNRRLRGYDQGELLARAVARRLPGARASACFRRRAGAAQTERDRADRLAGPALEWGRSRGLSGTVALVDDVRTTGASLAAAASLLRAHGALRVVAATIAATPDRSADPRSTIGVTAQPDPP